MTLPDDVYNGLLSRDSAPLVNVGTGTDISIRELAELLARLMNFDGELVFDATHEDGTPRKLLDVSRIHLLGWRARTSLEEGIRRTIESYDSQLSAGRS